MPYGYYQFVRITAFIGFGWLAYTEYEQKRAAIAIPCILLAVLFNPVIKVYLGREAWQMIDIVVAALLVIWVVADLVSLIYGKSSKKSCA